MSNYFQNGVKYNDDSGDSPTFSTFLSLIFLRSEVRTFLIDRVSNSIGPLAIFHEVDHNYARACD